MFAPCSTLKNALKKHVGFQGQKHRDTHFHASPWSPSPSSSRAASEDSRRCESPNKLSRYLWLGDWVTGWLTQWKKYLKKKGYQSINLSICISLLLWPGFFPHFSILFLCVPLIHLSFNLKQTRGAWFGPSAAAGRSSTLSHLQGLDKGRWMDYVGWNQMDFAGKHGGRCTMQRPCRLLGDFVAQLWKGVETVCNKGTTACCSRM